MILDKENIFFYQHALIGDSPSTNTIDLGPGDAGPSERLSLVVICDTPFTGSGTLSVELLTASAVDEDGNLAESFTLTSFSLPYYQLTAGGKVFASRLPHGCKRYLGLLCYIEGTLAGGKVTAALVYDVQADMPDPVTATAQGL